jgi:transcriptional regulator with XRE-family HTH domain
MTETSGGAATPAGSPLRIAELAALVDNRLARDSLKLRDAAAQAGVSAATLSRVLNGKVPDTATFAALVKWLGVSADLFIDRDREVSGAEAIEAHLRADRTLPPATAKALAALVRAAYADFGSIASDKD